MGGITGKGSFEKKKKGPRTISMKDREREASKETEKPEESEMTERREEREKRTGDHEHEHTLVTKTKRKKRKYFKKKRLLKMFLGVRQDWDNKVFIHISCQSPSVPYLQSHPKCGQPITHQATHLLLRLCS